jgi:membrane protease YdiL (CAAX protease family)
VNDTRAPVPRSSLADALVFLGGGVLVAGVVDLGVPGLTDAGVDPLAAWMLLAMPLVFVPIIAAGCLLVRAEGVRQSWGDRLRLRRLRAADGAWGLAGLVCIAAGSVAMMALCSELGLDPNPPFARDLSPLVGRRWWILGVFVVYWPINILGEEFVWRGVLLPRMEARFGARAWLVNGALWGTFHVAFGAGNLLVLVPTLVCVPLIAQRRRSTWLAVLLHAGLSGPGFVAISLGIV